MSQLLEPLLPAEGYVPHVDYNCGSLVHDKKLILPYAMSDKATAIVSVDLDALLAALMG